MELGASLPRGIADDDGGAETVTMAKINDRNTFRDRSANIDNSAGSRWTKSLGIRILAGVVRGRAKGAFAGLKNNAGSFDLPSHSATPVLSINVCFSEVRSGDHLPAPLSWNLSGAGFAVGLRRVKAHTSSLTAPRPELRYPLLSLYHNAEGSSLDCCDLASVSPERRSGRNA